MNATALEIQFRRYQESGDRDALGDVFDAVAPQLVLLASSLLREPQDAEDVVQATFVEVIRHRHRWSSDRPFLPWIRGVLVNLARRHRSSRTPGPTLEQRGSDDDPALLAEHQDSWDQLVRAIERQEPRYRRVLALRLLHGLTNVEISRVLEVREETVRTRFHRGIQRMRGALPGGLAVGFALLTSDRALGSVRAAIQQTAAVRVLPWSVLGGLLMERSVAAVGALVLLVSGAAFWWPRDEPPAPPSTATTRAVESPGQLPPPVPQAEAPTRQQLEATTPSDRVAATPSPAPAHSWIVQGMARQFPGDPIPGATIRATLDWTSGQTFLTTEADERGRYELSIDALRELDQRLREQCSVSLEADAPGHVGIRTLAIAPHSDLPQPPSDRAEPFVVTHDLQLFPGGRVFGRIVDQARNPVASARLSWQWDGEASEEPTPSPDPIHDSNRADGSFAIGLSRSPPGDHVFTVFHDQFGVHSQRVPVETLDADIDLGDVVLEPTHRVSGRLVLTDGGPLAAMPITVYSRDGAPRQLTTDSAGRFASVAFDTGPTHFEFVGALMAPQSFELKAGIDEDHVVQGHELVVRAVGAAGEPLPDIGIQFRAWSAEHAPPDLAECAAAGRPPGGACRFLGMSSGTMRLLLPSRAAVFCSGGGNGFRSQALGLHIGADRLRHEEELSLRRFQDPARLVLEVVDDLGRPCPNPAVSVFTTTVRFFPKYSWTHRDGNPSPEIPPGEYWLKVEARSQSRNEVYVPYTGELRLEDGEQHRLRATLPRAGSLHVNLAASLDDLDEASTLRVSAPDGRAVEGFLFLSAEPSGSPFGSPISTLAPSARLRGNTPLAPGVYEVTLTRPGLSDLVRSVEVRAFAVSELQFP